LLELRADQRRGEGLPQLAPDDRVVVPVDGPFHVGAQGEDGRVCYDGRRQGLLATLHRAVDDLRQALERRRRSF
jgi:hypothetical protein